MEFKVRTRGYSDVVGITQLVESVVMEAKVKEGMCLVFAPGSTVGLTMIEWEKGVVDDLKEVIERLIPGNLEYRHDKKWGDGNGFAHVRSALLPPTLCLPVEKGKLVHGMWQQIVLVDFDNRPRERVVKVVVK